MGVFVCRRARRQGDLSFLVLVYLTCMQSSFKTLIDVKVYARATRAAVARLRLGVVGNIVVPRAKLRVLLLYYELKQRRLRGVPSCMATRMPILIAELGVGGGSSSGVGGGGSGVSRLWVGDQDSALGWASANRARIVNCANINFEFAHDCERRWLNLNFRGELNGRSWQQRVEACVLFVLQGLGEANSNTLLHCKSGRHRSGSFGSLVLALVEGTSFKQAMEKYFEVRQLTQHQDQNIVKTLAHRLDLQSVLESLRSKKVVHSVLVSMIERMTYRILKLPPPPPPIPPPPPPRPRGSVALHFHEGSGAQGGDEVEDACEEVAGGDFGSGDVGEDPAAKPKPGKPCFFTEK